MVVTASYRVACDSGELVFFHLSCCCLAPGECASCACSKSPTIREANGEGGRRIECACCRVETIPAGVGTRRLLVHLPHKPVSRLEEYHRVVVSWLGNSAEMGVVVLNL